MYADDVALIAEEEQNMRSMISRLEGYLDTKVLTLSTEKTKIIQKRGREEEKVRVEMEGKDDRGG